MKAYEYLRYDYTQEEIKAAGSDLAAANHKRDSIERRKKEIVASLTAELEEQKAAITRLSDMIRMGFEWRDIEVRVELDTPIQGQKRVVRLDTGEEVAVKRMTDDDRQMVLDLQSKAEAAEAEAEKAKAPIVPPAPYVKRLPEGVDKMSSEEAHQMVVDAINRTAIRDIPIPATAGPTLAPARTQGGTYQKGTRGRKPRNAAAEAFVDGSAEEPQEEREYTPEEGAE